MHALCGTVWMLNGWMDAGDDEMKCFFSLLYVVVVWHYFCFWSCCCCLFKMLLLLLLLTVQKTLIMQYTCISRITKLCKLLSSHHIGETISHEVLTTFVVVVADAVADAFCCCCWYFVIFFILTCMKVVVVECVVYCYAEEAIKADY